VSGQLVSAERLLTEGRDSRTPTGQIEIGKMAWRVRHGNSVQILTSCR
jgi:hypothetical protein